MDKQSVNVVRIVQLTQKYRVESHIMRWAGILRFFAYAFPDGFIINDWYKFGMETVDKDIIHGFLHVLVDTDFITELQLVYKVVHDTELQRLLELADLVLRTQKALHKAPESRMLWSIPIGADVPTNIISSFHYINSWIIETAQRATRRILIVSPYYTESGMKVLEPTMLALLRNRPNVLMEFVVSDVAQEANAKAFRYLLDFAGHFHQKQIRVYQPASVTNESLWFHAKFLVADGESGYLGSANFSKRALDDQFELGVSLSRSQAETLERLVDYWIQCGSIVQHSFL